MIKLKPQRFYETLFPHRLFDVGGWADELRWKLAEVLSDLDLDSKMLLDDVEID